TRSFSDRTTLRLSFNERAPTISRLNLRTPTNIPSQLRLDLLDLEALDDVVLLHVAVVLERDAALEPRVDLLDVILEAPQARELPCPDHDAVAQEARVARPLDHAVLHHAARHRAHLGDPEDLPDLGLAEDLLHLGGR